MAKTAFQSGDVVSSAWLNSHFVANGGHVHDGSDDDGHAPKINISSHVSGVASFSNLPNMRLYGYRSGLSMFCEDRHITVGIGAAVSRNVFAVSGGINSTPLIVFGADLRKRVVTDAGAWSPWAAGTDSGSVPTTAAGWSQAIGNNVWLHCFILGKSSDRTAYEFGFDTSITAVNLREVASDWDMYRRMGSVRIKEYEGSLIITPFTNIGRRFLWKSGSESAFLNYVSTTLSVNRQLVSTLIPPDVFVLTMNRIVLSTSGLSGISAYVQVEDYNTALYDTSIFPTVFSNENLVYGESFALSDVYKRIQVSASSNGNINSLLGYTYGWFEDVDTM